MSRLIHVAVGVILSRNGEILIAKRPEQAHQGGLWEFPGGKVEPGESLFQALKRELYEELAINIVATQPLIKIRHDYGDKIVLLDVHKVTEFAGEAQGNEGQPVRWVSAKALYQYEFPAANRPIVTAINLPQKMLITGEASSPAELLKRTEKALQNGIRLAQLRLHEAHLSKEVAQDFVRLCNHNTAQAQINTSPEKFNKWFGDQTGVGLHLNSTELMKAQSRPVSLSVLLSASCHNEAEIRQAQQLGVDFICVSPVLPTQSHQGQPALGWEVFAGLVEAAGMPVFALGGMREADLSSAIGAGAQGIAAITEWWHA